MVAGGIEDGTGSEAGGAEVTIGKMTDDSPPVVVAGRSVNVGEVSISDGRTMAVPLVSGSDEITGT